jgi:antitoxin component YwqK of YwqJK toxin-antitoxin module
MKRFLWMAITLCISCLVFAQEEGVKIQWVERIPMGDGTMVYRYVTGDKKHLEGECRLAVNEREYIVADFKDGLPDGKWETYRYNKLYEKRSYKKGKIDGNVTTYGSDGKTVIAESTSSSGKRNGRYATYYSNGTLSKEQEFKEGKEHGYLRTYDQDGSSKWDCYYEDGKMHGQQTQLFFSNVGNYVKTSNYEHGVLVGDYAEYYEKGALKEKGQYDKNGKKTGVWQSGNRLHIYDESEYLNGERNGKQKILFSDGGTSKIQTYKDGTLNGPAVEYSEKTRKMERELTYVDGRKEGPFKTYYEDGKSLQSEGVYTRGNVTKRKTYYPNGKLKIVEEGEGFNFKVIEEYDETGKKIK